MTDLVFLIEPYENEFITPFKISNLYLNRFAIDEDDAFEIVGVYEMPSSRLKISGENLDEFFVEISEKKTDNFSIRTPKEDIKTFDFAFKNAIPKWIQENNYHVIYAGFNFISQYGKPENMYLVIYDIMKDLNLRSLTFTMIFMDRSHIVTKKVMKDYYKGQYQDMRGFDKLSVQDDLDDFYDQAKTFHFVDSSAGMFFLPMLTDEELILLENKDENYLRLYADFHSGDNPDVDEADMIESQSKSKFAYCLCFRISGYFYNE